MKRAYLTLFITVLYSTIFAQGSSATIKILLTDIDSIAETNAKIKISSTDKAFAHEGNTDEQGIMKVLLPLGKELSIEVYRYDTVFNFKQTIPVGNYGDYEIPFHLTIQVIRKVIKNYKLPVYFESNKFNITEENKKAIDDLFNQMTAKKEMKIEIGAHTDDEGGNNFNQLLSQNRANAIRSYLVSKGINESRIIAKGYGENKPVADNTTQIGKSQNRRVEISVTQTDK